MPPRSAKKAVAKKPSPKAKDATPPASKPSLESPVDTVEEKKDPEAAAEAKPAAGEMATAPESSVKEEAVEEEEADPEEDDPQASVEETVVPKSEIEDEVAEEDQDKEADDGESEMDLEKGVKKVEQSAVEGDTGSSGGDDNEENEDEDPSLHMQAKQKEFEIFVGGLHKEAVEDDLIKVFSVFGDIQSVRIMKHPVTQKSKGFGFIRYTTMEHAQKALDELNEGIEVKGKQARVSASKDKDTLYMGNICKTWTNDQVTETLKGLGVEQIENMLLPDDPKNEGKNKGFVFLEFASHSDAMAAFQRLRKPDAVFGCDRSAKVSFTTSMHPNDEELLKVKTVYIEGIPMSWDEEKVKDLCKQYGEIEKVELPRAVKKTKKKDFGFVEFTTRESALACVEGINNADLGEGETKVKSNLAKPRNKGRLSKQIARGGFIVNKAGEFIEEAYLNTKGRNGKSKEVPDKGKVQPNLKNTKGSQPSKSPGKVADGKGASQAGQPAKGKKRGGRVADTVNERPSKKARDDRNNGKMRGRPSYGSGNQRNTYSGMAKASYAQHPTTYGYQAHAYSGASGSAHRHSDLEPHGGYLPAAKHVQNPYGNQQIRAGAYNSHPSSGSRYAGAVPMIPPSYHGYPAYAGYEAGYAHPSSSGGAYAPRGGGYY